MKEMLTPLKQTLPPNYALSIGGFMRKLNDLFYED